MRHFAFPAIVFLIVSFPSTASAAGEATRCVLFIKKVELKTAAGDWKTAYQGNLPLDLAAADPAASFESKEAPEGQYVNARLTVDETVEITGSDGQAYTRDGGVIEIRGTASNLSALPGEIQSLDEKQPTYSEKEAGPIRVTLDFDYADRDTTIEIAPRRDFTKPVSVKPSSKITVTLRADVKTSVVRVWSGYYQGFPDHDVMVFTFPDSISEFSIKADGSTAFASGGISVQF